MSLGIGPPRPPKVTHLPKVGHLSIQSIIAKLCILSANETNPEVANAYSKSINFLIEHQMQQKAVK